ncbi:MAG TPA: ribosomal-protein-alanine N-acetyltransferase [Deltaproteobacteria bacterium]|nr:ribosomal-protein-alanine N-acetyltransferase [Deltaproteobacteria bacterium]
MDPVTFDAAAIENIDDIMEIENLSFPSPWDRATFLATFSDERCSNIVARSSGRIVGYCLAIEMNAMVHLLNLAVHPDYRNSGIAGDMLDEMESFAKRKNKAYVFLEVRKSNKVARYLYENRGFYHLSTWHGYYTDTGEDADVMIRRIKEGG